MLVTEIATATRTGVGYECDMPPIPAGERHFDGFAGDGETSMRWSRHQPDASDAVAELSRRMGLSHSTVSGIVNRLEARGFLRRVPREADRRFVEVELTRDIQRWLREELPASRSDPIAEALATGSALERAAIRDGVITLARLLAESRQ